MKHIKILCACLLLSVAGIAQTKNSLTVGASIQASPQQAFQSNTHYYYGLITQVGYFPTDNFAFGLRMEQGRDKDMHIPFSLNGYARLYFGDAKKNGVKLFVEAGAGAAHNATAQQDNIISEKDNKFKTMTYVSPGVNIKMGNIVALELAIEYDHVTGTTSINRLGASAGLRFFLNKQQFTNMFKYEFNSPY